MRKYRQLKKDTDVTFPNDVRKLRIALESQGITGDDKDIEVVYHTWSEAFHAVGWLNMDSGVHPEFLTWASLNACDD